ncbi:MAG: glycosyltransferase, partial [Planctomycetaceae bacterium]|nr:glycosyltransferase [Planctomycetaceae bacterium]
MAVIYDLIPLLFQSETIYDIDLMRSYRTLHELRRYDALLAISESTRADCRAMLGLPEHRVVTIGAASDPDFFCPEAPEARLQPEPVLLELGITRPFVLNVGGSDWRMNHVGMIDAFARLPRNLRERLQLVLTFSNFPDQDDALRRRATEVGIGGALILTGEVSDHALRALYRRCDAFVFPSLYEGFGLPLLEAMLCGAPVVAGNNSSQPEVVGDAGLLANAADPADLAAKLAAILRDPALTETLRIRALDQAGRFRWERVSARAAEVLERLSRGPSGHSLIMSPVRTASPEVRTADPTRDAEARIARTGLERRPVVRSCGARKPRIAFFSPFPPLNSGISDYSASLIRELTKTYEIDLYHATGYLPELGLASDAFECIDGRLFGRFSAARDYHAVVYQMGNSWHHSFLYETMLTHPGVVTLHDFCVTGFHLDYGFRLGDARGYFAKELLESYPEHEDEIRACLRSWPWDWEVISQDCARRGWYLNRRIVVRSGRVVVHSPWCVAQARADCPEFAERMVVIPMGAEPRRVSAERRAAIRARFQIPADAVVIACFGFIHPNKMCPEAITAFQGVAQADGSALFVLVGEENDGGEARRRAEELGLLDRVRFLGRRSRADFADLAAVTDLGVNLRRPPTFGETSAALLSLLASGIPTIVTDVGTFSGFPGDVVRKVRWESEGLDGLRH